jgi:hypothetical protein
VPRIAQEEWIPGDGSLEPFKDWNEVDENVDRLMEWKGTVRGPMRFVGLNCGKNMWENGGGSTSKQGGDRRGGFV